MRTFVIGDIHGAYIPLQQCLKRCGFDKENDLLITLGDICDGWPYVYQCVELLLTIKNRIDIIGNHDNWFLKFITDGHHPDNWVQGGYNTYESYLEAIYPSGTVTQLNPSDIPQSHVDFFRNQRLYYEDEKNRLFVHGGIQRFMPLDYTAIACPHVFYWDRDLFKQAGSLNNGKRLRFLEKFSEIFIGHTQVNYLYDDPQRPPQKRDIIWNLDTGAGGMGRLTIMDVDSHEYWQSDFSKEIYPGLKPR